jgi:hypothetical protein
VVEGRYVSRKPPPEVGDDLGGRRRCAHSTPKRCGNQSDSAGM